MRIELHKGALSAEGVVGRDAVTLSVAGESVETTATSTLHIERAQTILDALLLCATWREGGCILKRNGVAVDKVRSAEGTGSVLVTVRDAEGPVFRTAVTLSQADDLVDMLSTLLVYMEGDRHGI